MLYGYIILFYFIYYYFFFVILGLHPQHMEVPRLGVKWELLQLLAYTTATATQDLSHVGDLHQSSWQRQILNPLSEARDQTHIFMDTSLILNLHHSGNSLFQYFYKHNFILDTRMQIIFTG